MLRVVISLIAAVAFVVSTGGSSATAQASRSSSASYEFVVYNDTIHVYGRVLPKHSVIVDRSGTIIEIASNTTEDTVPKVYLESIAADTQIPLSENVHQQFRRLAPGGTSKAGILYKKDARQKPAIISATFLSF
jgi:hypothetical protein